MNKKQILYVLLSLILFINAFTLQDLKAESTDTELIVKDVDSSNRKITGFEYKIIKEDGYELELENIDKSTHRIILPKGKYLLRESKVPNIYKKNKDLYLELPKYENGKLLQVFNVIPKHKKIKDDKPDDKPDEKPDDKPYEPNIPKEKENTLSSEKTKENKNNKSDDNENNNELYDNIESPTSDLGSRDNINNENNTDNNEDTGNNKRGYAKTGEGKSQMISSMVVIAALITVILFISKTKKEESKDNEK